MDNKEQKAKEAGLVSQENTNNSLIKGDFDISNFFKKDKNFILFHKKVEKLISAIYLITNFLDDKESLKWKIRERGSKLLETSVSFKSSSFSQKDNSGDKIREIVLEIVSHLEVAMFANLISPMNFSILKREFYLALEVLKDIENKSKQNGASFSKDFFVEENSFGKEESRENISRTNSIGAVKDISSQKEEKPFSSLQQIKKPAPLKEFSSVSVKKNQRKSVIINLLKRKKEVMIKDIVGLIDNCSEKTIQRELLSLVDEGVLKKSGERRWTKYSLVN